MTHARCFRIAAAAAALALAAACRTALPAPNASPSANAYFSNWPAGAAPQDIGRRLAENWARREFGFAVNRPGRYDSVVQYAEAGTWYGALDVAALTHDAALEQRLIHKFDYLQTAEGARHVSHEAHVDFSIFGAIPLELYMHTKDASYLALGQGFADRQWANPTADGISREARYWADDMYMMTLLQVEAYRATGNRVYLDRMALTMNAYLDNLQQPNGLFFHGAGSPFFWGRGNGWVAAGMVELLRSLPAAHPRRAAIMASYRKMMATLRRHGESVDRSGHWQRSRGAVSLLRRKADAYR